MSGLRTVLEINIVNDFGKKKCSARGSRCRKRAWKLAVGSCSKQWRSLVSQHYATNTVPFCDDQSCRETFLGYVDRFMSGNIGWHKGLPKAESVEGIAEALDKIQKPVYQPMRVANARQEHETLVKLYDQAQAIVQDLRWNAQIGHIKAHIVCQC